MPALAPVNHGSAAMVALGAILVALGGGMGGLILFAGPSRPSTPILAVGVLFALFALYGVDLVLRGLMGSPDRKLFQGNVGLARAVLVLLIAGGLGVVLIMAVVVALTTGRVVELPRLGGAIMFVVFGSLALKGLRKNLRARRASTRRGRP
jgi:hypothetical protein